MKKTHRAVLRLLFEGNADFYYIKGRLKNLYPKMELGLNNYNITLLLNKLQEMEYIKSIYGSYPGLYGITPKGIGYVNLSVLEGVNHDKPSGP